MVLKDRLTAIGQFGGAASYLASNNAELFHAFGIMKLFGGVPPVWVVSGAMWIAPVATILAIVGFVTRPAMIVATLSTMFLTCLVEGWYPYWSHGYNLIFYATLPFMFGPAWASWSLDRAIARRWKGWIFGREVPERWYSWPVIAALWGASLFFFGAFVAKVYWGGLIDWWLSDNLRFSLAVTWIGYYDFHIPWHIDLIWSHPILYWGVGLVHMVMQFLPLTALFAIRLPAIRLAEGVVYAFGVYALYLFMTVWNPSWFFVAAAVFVDWDWLLRKLGQRFAAATAVPKVPRDWQVGSAVHLVMAFLSVYFGYYAYVFTFQRGEKELNYPFSSLAMYASVRANPPYNVHRHYDFYRGAIGAKLASCDVSESAWSGVINFANFAPDFRARVTGRVKKHCTNGGDYRFAFISSTYPEMWRVETLTGIKSALEAIEKYLDKAAESWVPGMAESWVPGIEELLLYKQIAHYPAYPDPVYPVVAHEGLRGALTRDGQFRGAVGRYYRDTASQKLIIEVETAGFVDPEIRMIYRIDAREKPGVQPVEALPGHWEGNKFVIDEKTWKKPGFSLIEVREKSESRTYDFYGPDNLS